MSGKVLAQRLGSLAVQGLGGQQLAVGMKALAWNMNRAFSQQDATTEEKHSSQAGQSSTNTMPSEVSGSVKQQQWIDKYAPQLQEKLEQATRDLWLRGVKERCQRHPALIRAVEEAPQYVAQEQKALMDKYRDAGDRNSRYQTHLLSASLLLATYKVLLPYVRNQQEVLDILKQQAFAQQQTTLLVRFFLQLNLWARRYLRREPPVDTAHWLLSTLNMDLGEHFEGAVVKDKGGGRVMLKVPRCQYYDIFKEQDALQLLECTCCKADQELYLTGLDGKGVKLQHIEWKGKGDEACQLAFVAQKD